MPLAEADQRQWMAKLMDSKVSDVVAASPAAPQGTQGMLDVAEAQGFPASAAGYELHFVSLAAPSSRSDRVRAAAVASIKRLYDVYWKSLHARGTLGERLSALEIATGWGLEVRDQLAGELIATGRRAFATQRDGQPAFDRVDITIPGAGEVVLVAAGGVDRSAIPRWGPHRWPGGVGVGTPAAQQDRLRPRVGTCCGCARGKHHTFGGVA